MYMKKILTIVAFLAVVCACVYFIVDRKEVVEVPTVETMDSLQVVTDSLAMSADTLNVVDTLK